MDALNMPLEMIAVCSPEGELSPARFRLETESGERITVRIRQIRRREEIRLMGVESIRFDCLALLGGRLRRFELRYGVRAARTVPRSTFSFLDREAPAGRCEFSVHPHM